MSTIKNQRCFTEATASARLILATGLGYQSQTTTSTNDLNTAVNILSIQVTTALVGHKNSTLTFHDL